MSRVKPSELAFLCFATMVLIGGLVVHEDRAAAESNRDAKIDMLLDEVREQRVEIRELKVRLVEHELDEVREKIDNLGDAIDDTMGDARVRYEQDEYERGWDEAMEACEDHGSYQEPP